MIISVVNHSEYTDEYVQEALRAINRQIAEDFAPYWHRSGELRLEDREVWVQRREAGYYTQPKIDKDLRVETTAETRRLGETIVAHGTVEVVTQVLGYQRKSISTGLREISLTSVTRASRMSGSL